MAGVLERLARVGEVQLSLELDDQRVVVPWQGVSPRELARQAVARRISMFLLTTGGVDNSVIGCPSREAQRFGTDPAQYQLCVSTSFKKEV